MGENPVTAVLGMSPIIFIFYNFVLYNINTYIMSYFFFQSTQFREPLISFYWRANMSALIHLTCLWCGTVSAVILCH